MRSRNLYPSPFRHVSAFSMACKSLDGDFTDSDPRVPCFYPPITWAKGRLAHVKQRDLWAPSAQGKNSDVFESQTWAAGGCAGQNQHLAAGDPVSLQRCGAGENRLVSREETHSAVKSSRRNPSEPLGAPQSNPGTQRSRVLRSLWLAAPFKVCVKPLLLLYWTISHMLKNIHK